MLPNDLAQFSELLDAIWGLKGAPAPTAAQKAMFFRALAVHPLDEVRAGLDAHIRDPERGRFLPMPADVIAQINGMVAADGRPGAEEAWATVFAARDEAMTTVWTAEMAEAAGVCRSLLLAGDEVAARMAFKESYGRLVSMARAQRTPAVWSATLGHDIAGRDAALMPHIKAGRVSNALLAGPSIGLDAAVQLPAPEGETETGRAARLKARERLAEMRSEQAKPRKGADEIERERTAALKAETAAKVRNYPATTFNATGI